VDETTSALVSRFVGQITRRRAELLAILQHAEDVNGNVSMTCRHYGISQPV
jgi:hypothetical protein